MKIRCDRQELADRLQSVSGIILTTPTTKPILKNFLLRASGDSLFIEATDLDMSARLRVDRVEVEREGKLALSASHLQGIVREIPSTMVSIESAGDGREAILRAEGYELRLLGDDPDEFPELKPFMSEGALQIHRERFMEMLRRVSIAASRDTSRYQLTGVFFEIDGDRLLMTATDGKRLTHDMIRLENRQGEAVSAIVPNRAIDVMIKVLATGEDTVDLSILETESQLSFGHGQLMSKHVEGTFPDYQTALPSEKKTKVLAKRADLLSAVRSASLVTDRETATIIFHFEGDVVRLESHASNVGESKIEVPVSMEGEPLEIRFNPVYFIDALRTVQEEEIRMEFCGSGSPGTIRSGVNYRHLLMPLIVG